MSFSWIVSDFIVSLQNIFRDILYLCKEFWYCLFILRTEVNIHHWQDCFYWVLRRCINDLTIWVHWGQCQIQLLTEPYHVGMITSKLRSTDLDFIIFDQIIFWNPFWLLFCFDHLSYRFLLYWTSTELFWLENKNILLLF